MPCPFPLLLLLEVKVRVLTSPSFLASSVISMNFWISEMVGPVKSSTGIIVCFRLAEDRTVQARVKCCTVQCSAVQCSAVQCSAVQCSTVR